MVDGNDSSSSSVEYSIAMAYNGSPLSYSIPDIPPFIIDQIPVAIMAPSPNHEFPVPIIQPLAKLKLATDSEFPSIESSNRENNNPGSLEVPEDDDDDKENKGFNNEINPISMNSDTTTESGLSSPRSDCSEMVDNEVFDDSQFESFPVPPRGLRYGKKGSCYRCLKGNRLMEKEVCIVCSAKYCRKCVIRAMGCMPEGRKCVTCIGYRIDGNYRKTLGKCSRMLKYLFSESEVTQIMHVERFCEANQIPPDLVRVNGKPLDREELMKLLNCPNPPKALKQRFYWYDKASGFRGMVKT